jgi:hypothetical protein
VIGKSYFLIHNPATGDFKTVYGTRTMPALWVSRAAAQGELSKQHKRGLYKQYLVLEVTLEERWK